MADLTWLAAGCVGGCAYPLHEADLADLAQQGVSVLINLHERAHAPEPLARYGLREVHLPVPDLSRPRQRNSTRGSTRSSRPDEQASGSQSTAGQGWDEQGPCWPVTWCTRACHPAKPSLASGPRGRVRSGRPSRKAPCTPTPGTCPAAPQRRGSEGEAPLPAGPPTSATLDESARRSALAASAGPDQTPKRRPCPRGPMPPSDLPGTALATVGPPRLPSSRGRATAARPQAARWPACACVACGGARSGLS
jgi:hypothetical protein